MFCCSHLKVHTKLLALPRNGTVSFGIHKKEKERKKLDYLRSSSDVLATTSADMSMENQILNEENGVDRRRQRGCSSSWCYVDFVQQKDL